MFISIAHVYGQRDTIWISKQKDWRAYTFQFDWDTVYFISDQISCPLQGTIKIPWSKNQEFVRDAGLKFLGIESSECSSKGEPVDHIPEEISSIKRLGDELRITAKVKGNCCYDFICDVGIIDNQTLNLIYYGYGNICGCNCCYSIIYRFKIEDNEKFDSIGKVVLNSNLEIVKLK